ncbi:BamA/TamA family outer membrane protein [Yersinia aldovae]|uniref:BamA/TamA family outer membrane protein n=1 Tax=Yersinia aldovae TaxID=29483 RepID=UPI0011A7BAB2|nr:BamA/TamA family outer membrane protein [Yersinia aldovae]
MCFICRLGFVCWLGLPCLAQAVDILPSHEHIDGWLQGLGSDNKFDANKGIDWGVMPGPFYTPELGLGIGAAIVGMYRPDKKEKISQNSTLSFSGFTSSTGAFGIGIANYSFFANDQWRFYLTGAMNNMPTYYWGTGFTAGRDDVNKQEYTSQEFSAKPELLYRIAPDIYFGVGWSFSSVNAASIQDKDNGMLAREKAGPSVLSSGASVTLTYDTRDFVPNPRSGQLANLTYTYFAPELGSDFRFESVESRYALYHALDEKNVLAWEIDGRFTQGDVPWNMLPLLGDNHRMRGYYEGRYRDRNVLSTQLEYRRKLDWRHGVVAWIGSGTMSQTINELGKSSWLPSVGVGYRFEFKPRMNVRLDFGVGKDSTGFYFQVGEAF